MINLKIHITVTGNFEPSHFTKIAGVEATMAFNKGDKIFPSEDPKLSNIPPIKNDLWRYSTSIDEVYSIEEYLEKMIDLFIEERIDILEFIKLNSLDFGLKCVIYSATEDSMPEIYISNHTLQKISLMGLSFELDVY